MYHDGSRRLQERFQTRRLADRMVEKIVHGAFTDADRAFIETRPMFFLATADVSVLPGLLVQGRASRLRPRGGSAETLAFPSYDGNGMFKSLGNLLANPQVGLLFIDFESPKRLRVNGRATVREDDPLLAELPGRPARRARARRGDLPELPALYPHDDDGGDVGICAVRGPHAARARVEAAADVPRGAPIP